MKREIAMAVVDFVDSETVRWLPLELEMLLEMGR
jgi:hypothetical protein